MGTSMGGMHTWMWGFMFPGFMDGLVPLASNPVEIAGRNRVWRKLLVDAIVNDPTWKNGEYTEPPRGLPNAIGFLLMATSVPLQWQKQFPTAAAADEWLAGQIASRAKTSDANDMIYYFRASEDYDPSPHLDRIAAPLLAINSADDFVNPPELPMMETLIKKVKRGRFVSDSDFRPHARPRHALAATVVERHAVRFSRGVEIAMSKRLSRLVTGVATRRYRVRRARRAAAPSTRRRAKVDHVDTYHGVKVARPLPVARGRYVRGDRRVGRGSEQGHLSRTSRRFRSASTSRTGSAS